jgi:hypothetical protein
MQIRIVNISGSNNSMCLLASFLKDALDIKEIVSLSVFQVTEMFHKEAPLSVMPRHVPQPIYHVHRVIIHIALLNRPRNKLLKIVIYLFCSTLNGLHTEEGVAG